MKSKGGQLDEDCPIRSLVNLIGDKWTPIVLYVLAQGTLRYSDFARRLPGISRKMLTQTLRRLEKDGLVKRTVYAVVPPKVEYRLTPLGERFLEAVTALHEWAVRHQEDLRAVHGRRKRG